MSETLGKTTVAARVTERINERYFASQRTKTETTSHHKADTSETARTTIDVPLAAFVPMDGFHLSRAQLSAMPDPEQAHARRGAAFTFDGDAFLALVRQAREPLEAVSTTAAIAGAEIRAGAAEGGEGMGTGDSLSSSSLSSSSLSRPQSSKQATRMLYAPSFDHALKDPVANDIAIALTTRVLFFEGNYLSLDRPPWRDAARLMDELWFVEVEFDVARERLVNRHVQAGIAADVKEARKRVQENDLVNGKEIVDGRHPVDEIILSQ